MKTLLIITTIVLTSCGAPYTVTYINPETGVSAGYSSKGGIVIDYRPVSDK